MAKKISLVIPVFNEEKNILPLLDRLDLVLKNLPYEWEIIFIDDGSKDNSAEIVRRLKAADYRIQLIEFTRNFGKEIALAAGINNCSGDACVMIDSDLQHPPEIIPQFIDEWEKGVDVVVGVRKDEGGPVLRRLASNFFYTILNSIAETKVIVRGTDFRLIDRRVIEEFKRFKEERRLTRGLIDWLGFKESRILFSAPKRANGDAQYSFNSLVRLAVTSVTKHSYFPLRLAGYLGIIIMLISAPLGLFIFIENYLLHDPWQLNFTGTAMLAVFIMFLDGIILACLGLVGVYIGNIQNEVVGRPLFVIKRRE